MSIIKREFLAEHGFEVIDAHIHPFLENEGANIAGFGSPASPDEFVAELKSLGIAKACGSVILHKDCRMEAIREANVVENILGNRYKRFDGRIIGYEFLYIFPVALWNGVRGRPWGPGI